MRLADRAPILIIVALGLLSQVRGAAAQSAEAEALFQDGRKLIKDGEIAAGCDKLEASERLESSVGTLLNLGDCREKLGKIASAWAAFQKAEAMAQRNGNDAKRQREAHRRAAKLERRLSYIVVQVREPIKGLVVRRGDEVIDDGVWNTPVPVDSGEYKVTAEAPGFLAWSTDVRISAKTRHRVVVVPALQREPTRPPPEAPIADPTPAAAPIEPIVVVHERDRGRAGMWTPARKISLGVAAVGAGALGGGIYFGLRAQDLEERSDRRCPVTLCADPEGLRLNDEAQDAALRANLFYAAGGAAIAAAAILWIAGAPDDDTVVAPTVGDDHVGVSLAGRF